MNNFHPYYAIPYIAGAVVRRLGPLVTLAVSQPLAVAAEHSPVHVPGDGAQPAGQADTDSNSRRLPGALSLSADPLSMGRQREPTIGPQRAVIRRRLAMAAARRLTSRSSVARPVRGTGPAEAVASSSQRGTRLRSASWSRHTRTGTTNAQERQRTRAQRKAEQRAARASASGAAERARRMDEQAFTAHEEWVREARVLHDEVATAAHVLLGDHGQPGSAVQRAEERVERQELLWQVLERPEVAAAGRLPPYASLAIFTLATVPWPVLGPVHSLDDITWNAVTEFVLHPASTQGGMEWTSKLSKRWRLDNIRKFLLPMVDAAHRPSVLQGADKVAKVLGQLGIQ